MSSNRPLVAAILVWAFSACQPTEPPSPPPTPGGPKTIIPKPEVRSEVSLQNVQPEPSEPRRETPKVSLDGNESLVDLLTSNLDLDRTDEQILVVQEGEGRPIRILVVDYDEVRDRWERAVDYVTQATVPRALRVEPEDIIGDYRLEIVVQGVAADGSTTLDVLRRIPSPTGTGIRYVPIFRGAADRSIAIEQHRRPQSYQFGQKYDKSFPIVLEKTDPESESETDIIRETYHWRYQSQRYVKLSEKKIRADELLQQQLRQLFSSTSSQRDYERFLEGPWYKENEITTLVVFSPDEGTVTFFDGEIQEVYRTTYYDLRGYRLTMLVRNDALSTVQRRSISLRIESMDSISLGIRDNSLARWDDDVWTASYRRLGPELQQSIMADTVRRAGPSDVTLDGIYRGVDGQEIAFERPHFTWIEEDGSSRGGGFALTARIPLLNSYYLERDMPETVQVISFKFVTRDRTHTEDATYILEYDEKSENNAVVRTISLIPATLTVRGAYVTSRQSQVLEQIEMVNQS